MRKDYVIKKFDSIVDKLKKGWCIETYARNSAGYTVNYRSKSAKSYCVVGAIRSSTNRGRVRDAICSAVLQSLECKGSISILEYWNDKQVNKKCMLIWMDRARKVLLSSVEINV